MDITFTVELYDGNEIKCLFLKFYLFCIIFIMA